MVVASPVRLPDELWLHITSFLLDELPKLYSINSLFFHLSMCAKYRTIELRNLEDRHSTNNLCRLQEPMVARYVKRLEIDISGVNNLERDTPSRASIRSKRTRPISATLGDLLSWFGYRFSARDEARTSSGPLLEKIWPSLTSLEEMRYMFTNAPPSLDHVLPWCIASTLHGSRLRKLALHGHTPGFPDLLAQRPYLPVLDELFLSFSNRYLHPNDVLNSTSIEVDQGILDGSVVAFLNDLSSHLHSLEIWSWASAPLDGLFASLDTFAKLTKFGLRTHFNWTLTGDNGGEGLGQFLKRNASSMRSLSLRLNPTGSALDPVNSESPLSQWMTQTLGSDRLPFRLNVLEIYPTKLQGGWDATLSLIRQCSSTLTDLSIRDKYLGLEEVNSVVDALDDNKSNLKLLRMNIQGTFLDVTDLLASEMRQLSRLYLSLGNDRHSDLALIAFCTEMQGRGYEDWELTEFEVWQARDRLGLDKLIDIIKCFPFLKQS